MHLNFKFKNIKYAVLFGLMFACVFFSSCTPAVYSENPLKRGPSKSISEINQLINEGSYNIAEKELVAHISSEPENTEFRKSLALLYFKTSNYSACEKFIRSVINIEPGVFKSVNDNGEFDLYYAFIASMIRQNKLNSAAEYISLLSDPYKLSDENRTKFDLLMVEYQYRSKNFGVMEEMVKNIFNRDPIRNGQRLNLYYILAVSNINMNRIDSALDNAIFLILNDHDFKYTRKIKRLLDGIVNNANEELLDKLKSKITDGYRELAARSDDNANLKEKILMDINILENSEVTVEMKTPQQDQSYISKIRLYTDRDVTSVYLTSADSIIYENPPLYDGKTLTLRIPNKKINSAVNSQRSLPGSGIETVEWKSEGDTIVFRVNLSSNLNLTIEESSGESFEKSDKLNERYSLKINVYLPEPLTAAAAPDIDFGEDRYTIVLDPGHGGDDPGAIGILKKSDGNRYTEKEMNLDLCRLLKKYLEDNGYRVFLTRDGDYYPSLHERNRIAQNRNADMFISLHLNSASVINKKYWQTDRYYGAEMLVRESIGVMPKFINFQQSNLREWRKQRETALEEHKKLSDYLAESIPNSLHYPFNKKRRIIKRNLVIFSGMTIPHALIEAGFIINNKSLEYLLSERGQQALFKGVLEGIEKYRKASY